MAHAFAAMIAFGAALASVFYDVLIRDILIARKPPEPGVIGEGETLQDRPGPERIA